MLKYFTLETTEGYSQFELDFLNYELETMLDGDNDPDTAQNYAGIILARYDSNAAFYSTTAG